MIKDIILYFKYQKIIKQVFQDDKFIKALNASFGVKFKRDKINRLYTVINPYIQNITDEGNTIIYDAENKPVIERWMAGNFNIIRSIIGDNQLFDIVSYDIKKLDEDLNYSLILQNAMWPFFKKALIKIGAILLGLIITGILLIILL